MSSESPLPPPSPSAASGRNPWKIFGIATIVVVLAGGAVAVGYFLGTSSNEDGATSTSSAPQATSEPATASQPLSDDNAPALEAIANASARGDALNDDWQSNWESQKMGPYQDSVDIALDVFQRSTTCDERAAALDDALARRKAVEVYLDRIVDGLAAQQDTLERYQRGSNPPEVSRAALEAIRKIVSNSMDMNLAQVNASRADRTVDEMQRSMDENC